MHIVARQAANGELGPVQPAFSNDLPCVLDQYPRLPGWCLSLRQLLVAPRRAGPWWLVRAWPYGNRGGPVLLWRGQRWLMHGRSRALVVHQRDKGRANNRLIASSFNIVAILLLEECGEHAPFALQLPEGSLLGNQPIFEHDDLIHVAERAQAVGDHQHCASNDQLIQGMHDFGLRLDVQAGGRLVEYQDRPIAQNSARYGQTLALAAREVLALFADVGIVTIWQAHDRLVHLSFLRRVDDLILAGPWFADLDILADCAFEEDRILENHTHILAQDAEGVHAAVDAVEFSASRP